MIVTQTPCRMSFAGGGSDMPAFYRQYGGAVVSTAIDRYVNVIVNAKFDGGVRVGYSRTEVCEHAGQVRHPIVREALKMMGIEKGIEIVSIADIPSSGTGLGSSSAFTVGLLNGLHAFRGERAGSDQLGRESCEIEIDVLGEPIGKQDQYAVAAGGLNLIEFHEDDSVSVDPLRCPEGVEDSIQSSIIAFYTGIERRASDILRAQNDVIEAGGKSDVLKRMTRQAHELCRELRAGNAEALGEALHEGWLLKKSITPEISSAQIDAWYERARGEGASGGKLLGAGAGGFLIFYAKPERHEAIRRALGELRPVTFGFDRNGSRIVYADSRVP